VCHHISTGVYIYGERGEEREDEDEDVSSYWMNFSKIEGSVV